MSLALQALSLRVPAEAPQNNLLGTVVPAAYRHLYDAAGAFSRPASVRRGVTRLYSEPYAAPAADAAQRSGELAAEAVAALLRDAAGKSPVEAIFHTQCTLDQQILGSTCLRLQHEHAQDAHTALTIGQLGTAGLPTALHLAARRPRSGAVLVSACDKWIAPFYRRQPGLVTYADAAGACLSAARGGPAVARIEAIEVVGRPPAFDAWTAPAQVQRDHLAQGALAALQALQVRMAPALWVQSFVAGDGYADALADEVAAAAGLLPRALAPARPGIHLSSASVLAGIACGIEAAAEQGQPLSLVVWTASLCGHAAALHVSCSPHARRTPSGWTAPAALH